VIYQKTISTGHNIAAFVYNRAVLKVCKGLVYKVEILFPPGCAGLLKVKIRDGGHQVWPSNEGESFATDGFTISFEDTLLKLASPYQYDIFTVNEDTLYDHSVTIRIGMVSKEIYMARFLPTIAYERMLEVLHAEQARQEDLAEKEREALIEHPFTWIEKGPSPGIGE